MASGPTLAPTAQLMPRKLQHNAVELLLELRSLLSGRLLETVPGADIEYCDRKREQRDDAFQVYPFYCRPDSVAVAPAIGNTTVRTNWGI